MSQVTEQSVRFQTALASIKLIQASAVLDLTEDDFDFLTSNKVWIATDRSRARRCVEACVYGTLDFVGDRKSGSAGMPRPISYAVFCLKKKISRIQSMIHLRRKRIVVFALGRVLALGRKNQNKSLV